MWNQRRRAGGGAAIRSGKRLLSLAGFPVEVHCTCPVDIAVARYNTRPRHPVHVTAAHRPEAELAQFNKPVGIGSLITVDTTKQADVPAVASQVRRLHARAPEACANTAGIHAAGAIAGGKAIAAMDGRPSVAIEDIRRVAVPVLRHRLATNFQAQAEGMTSESIIARLLDEIPEPKIPKYV